jgi:biotin operon repressor
MTSWMTIAAASQVRSPLSQSELADMLSVSGASMVHMIDRLAKAGLVIREPSNSDRRVNRVVITDAGPSPLCGIKGRSRSRSSAIAGQRRIGKTRASDRTTRAVAMHISAESRR